MNYMLLPLKRYFDFSGRSRRKEYWMFALFLVILSILAMILDTQLGLGGQTTTYSDFENGASVGFNSTGGILTLILMVVTFIPSLAVGVRRLHDTDRSGWWYLIVLVPFVGAIVLLVFFCLEGTRGPNRFGPDPKGSDAAAAFA